MTSCRLTATACAALTALAALAACTPSAGHAAPSSTVRQFPTARSATPAGSSTTPGRLGTSAAGPGSPIGGHVVVVVEENHSYGDIVGNPQAPYFNALAGAGVSLTSLRAITHPSEPNYLALFSGSTQGVTSDACPLSFAGVNLGSELRAHGLTFTGFSEGLPRTGSTVCAAGAYGRKHAPWTDFTDLPGTVNQPLTAFPSDFARLPTVAFVIPNLDHDMHDGTIGEADGWLREHLGNYASWAVSHQSLLIVTWDEDDFSQANQIPTFVVGAGVRAHRVTTATTLYSVLRLIEDRYELPRLGSAATAAAISLG